MIDQCIKAGTGANVLEAKKLLSWTDAYKVMAVDPCYSGDTRDASAPQTKLLEFDLPLDVPGADAHGPVSVQSCKPCANLDDSDDSDDSNDSDHAVTAVSMQ